MTAASIGYRKTVNQKDHFEGNCQCLKMAGVLRSAGVSTQVGVNHFIHILRHDDDGALCTSPISGDLSCAMVKGGWAAKWLKFWRDHECAP